ncbi:MAG: DNA-processing protein DprA [Magnetococcales bacterium]|nr:DNA-processing protein DprA [Magnetococcales bacterium]
MDRITVCDPELNPGDFPGLPLRRDDPRCPPHLAGMPEGVVPVELVALGNLELLRLPMVGVAGAREASGTGIGVTTEYVGHLAARGINIVSGHAAGVDLAAHRAALDAGGVTTVVPAEGLQGFKLRADLRPALEEGRLLILSPFPPEAGWKPWRAIRRNRFIVGLSHAVLVIESGNAGGTFQSAQAARELKRPLFVIFYGGTIASAVGNRYFLEQGARPVGRTPRMEPDLAELLETVRRQHQGGNPPWEPPLKPDRNAMDEDRRLIEDYLPIEAIGVEASREKSVRKGHISTLHLWWARRPLVACRAAVFGALATLEPFRPANGPEEKRDSLARANVAKFMKDLCTYPAPETPLKQARLHLLKAHAARLSRERGEAVTVQDILDGQAPRPRVLDMFAGGGAIPLEALRLGCESHALDLNPVAHIIQLATLVYPQQFGKPDPLVRGMTGEKNARGETTWGGLAKEVRYWGKWVLNKVQAEIGDLYPSHLDTGRQATEPATLEGLWEGENGDSLSRRVMPLAYLWTRTIACKNPQCRAVVPLLRQTWLCRKNKRFIALRKIVHAEEKRVRFQTVIAASADGLGFEPAEGSRGGNVACPFCGTVADAKYVKGESQAGLMGRQLMAVVVQGGRQKVYLDASPTEADEIESAASFERIQEMAQRLGITVPDEPLEANPRSFDVQHYGFNLWRDLFTPRQLAAMVAFAGCSRSAQDAMAAQGVPQEQAKAVAVTLSMVVGRLADYCTSFCTWQPEFIKNTFNAPGLPMIWDFAETNPLAGASGSWESALDYVASVIEILPTDAQPARVGRGSAMKLPFADDFFDAVITDPPYYDSRSYSNLSDHFFVWHKRILGELLPEHFSLTLTPKKAEAIAAAYRHDGNWGKADAAYEEMMAQSFREACRVLRPGCPMVCVYAHKTTAGWSTVINSLRQAGFAIHEAWPIIMERSSRQNAQQTSALASSIFLVARKRGDHGIGAYETVVRPDLEAIVRERVDTLWKMGIVGGDLVIAAVGAGLRAFTRYARVELANGDEVPAERFLAEVEGVVLEQLLEKIFGVASSVSGVDGPTRFYVLWRYAHQAAEMESGEAIVFTYGQNVELDGPDGLSTGVRALLDKKKSLYRLRDFSERGGDEQLGQPDGDAPAPAIDVLHRLLWLLENAPRRITPFLDELQPNRDRLRMIAQALSGAALSGKKEYDHVESVVTTPAEHASLTKLLANWRAVVEQKGLFG